MKNLEIKARYPWTDEVVNILNEIDAQFKTVEIQTDTYFDVNNGRIKIRERLGKDAEMIQYFREDKADIKECSFSLVHVKNPESVKSILTREHGIREVIQKHREIWIWHNVRIHFDRVKKLGEFIELEAGIDDDNPVDVSESRIRELMVKFDIKKHNLIEQSYIDLIESLEKSQS